MKSNARMTEIVSLSILCIALSACGSSSSSSGGEDSSASGAAASAVGGALSASSANGTQASYTAKRPTSLIASAQNAFDFMPSARAGNTCPTFKSSSSAGCQVSTDEMWLSYDDCSHGGGALTWNGVQALTLSSGTAACGQFPNPGDNGTLTRQYVAAAGANTPGSITVTDALGLMATIDDSQTNLGNFDNDPITGIPSVGYGAQVAFNSTGARDSVTVDHQIVAPTFNHSITGTLAIAETAGASTRTVTGSLTVYHNLLKVIGTATFNNVVHSDSCCTPISGSISTVFKAGTHVAPTTKGALMVGGTETLTFNSCGSGTLVSYDGTSTTVSTSRCF